MKISTKLPAIALLISSSPFWYGSTAASEPLVGNQSIVAGNNEAGNLNVSGDVVAGNISSIGTLEFGVASNPSYAAIQMSYLGSTTKTGFWDLVDSSGAFAWRDNSGMSARNKMVIDGSNVLTLYNTSGNTNGNSGIVMDPTNGTVTIGGSGVVTTASTASALNGLGVQVSSGNLTIPSTQVSTSTSTGALVVAGGVGIGMDSFINGVRVGTGNGTQAGNNTVFGKNTLLANTTGIGLLAIGSNALTLNLTGSHNVAIGDSALSKNTTGSDNLAVGAYALYNNTNGVANVAIGAGSLVSNISGTHNQGIGGKTLHLNTVGTSNTAIGHAALYSNSSGGANIAIGNNSLLSNASGRFNCAMGVYGQYSGISAEKNTSLGNEAMFSNVIQSSNTALGFGSLRYLTGGGDNIAIGVEAGSKRQNGANAESASQSILIGNATKTSVTGAQNSIVIGHGAVGEGSNTTVIGNDATETTHIRGNAVLDSATLHGIIIIAEPQGDISMGIYD